MSEFILIHMLKPYGLSNCNTDMYGRPKQIYTYGRENPSVRFSCQNILSTVIREAFKENGHAVSTNTTQIDVYFIYELTKTITENEKTMNGIPESLAKEYAAILKAKLTPKTEVKPNPEESSDEDTDENETVNEKPKAKSAKENSEKKKKESSVLIRLSSADFRAIDNLIKKIRSGYEPKEEDFEIYTNNPDIDSLFFGQMDAKNPERNIVSGWYQNHPFSVTNTVIETDFFAAQDDLRKNNGAAHLGQKSYSNGLFYYFSVANVDLLIHNFLIGKEDTPVNRAEARKKVFEAIRVAVQGLIKRSPPGRAAKNADTYSYASYVMLEKGSSQPRGFSSVFSKPVGNEDPVKEAIQRIKTAHDDLNATEINDVQYVDFELGKDLKADYQRLFDFLQ